MFVKLSVFVIVIIFSSLSASGDEQTNCKLDKDEQILGKLIRTEGKVDSMLIEIRKSEEHVLAVLEYRKQEMQKTLTNTEENVENKIEEMKTELTQLKIQIEKVNTATKRVGSPYVRWGRTTCPADNELVYKGLAGGSYSTTPGGAANWLCHTDHPQWANHRKDIVYGGVNDFSDYIQRTDGADLFGKSLNDNDIPCSVCRPPRSSAVIIPGSVECPSGWKNEYSGYIVYGASVNNTASDSICLDKDAKELTNGNYRAGGRVINQAQVKCGTLKCPPYVDSRKITCVVCTK